MRELFDVRRRLGAVQQSAETMDALSVEAESIVFA
jgi:hypothetical protein